MAITTAAAASTLHPIPTTVDLRLLSHSDLSSLSSSVNLSSLSPIIPTLNPSLFNESAGSRKQTFSRLPLSSSNSNPNPSPNPNPRRRGRPRLHPLPAPTPTPTPAPAPALDIKPPADFTGRAENLQIVSHLKNLFLAREKRQLTLSCDAVTRNSKGEEVDLESLAGVEDLFGEEMRRRTEGLKTEEQILGYMTGLDGVWGSRRKRRKVVDAVVFGSGLPVGWKVLLGMKRKDGVVFLDCRRYVSPSGKQFASCKEVSAYILSLKGHQDSEQLISFDYSESVSKPNKLNPVAGLTHQNHQVMVNCSFVAPISQVSPQYERHAMAHSVDTLVCWKCNLTFGDKDTHMQHLLTFHQSAKRRKIGKSLVAGVIMKGGRYECQFCHKTFSEKHCYTGHIGAHIRYEGLGVNAGVPDNPSSLAVVPYVPPELNVSANKTEAYTTKSVSGPQIDLSPCVSGSVKNGIKYSPKEAQPETTKVEGCNIACDESKEVVEASNATGTTPNSCTNVISRPAIIVNSVENTCFPVITRENLSKSLHDPVNNCERTVEKSGTIDDSNTHKGKFDLVNKDSIGLDLATMDSTNTIQCNTGNISHVISPSATDVNSAEQTCSPVITREDPSRSVHDPVNDFEMTIDSAEQSKIQDGKSDLTNICNACVDVLDSTNSVHCKLIDNNIVDVISPSATDVNSLVQTCLEQTCSPIITRANSSKSVYDPANDKCGIIEESVNESGIIEESNTQDGKHDLTDMDTIGPDLATMNATNPELCILSEYCDDNMVGDESKNNIDTNNKMGVEFVDEIGGHSCPKGKFVSEQINGCNVKSNESLYVEANACMDALSPAIVNLDNMNSDDPNAVSASHYKEDQRIYVENNLLSLSGNGLSYGVETYGNNIFTSSVVREQHTDLGTFINEKTHTRNFDDLTNKEMGFMSTMHGELHNSCIMDNIASEPTSGIDTNADCMFAGDMTKSLLEGIDRVGNAYQNCFDSSDICNMGSGGIIMGNGDERQAMQVVGDTSSSWAQSSEGLPILNMIPNQCEDELHSTGPKNGQVTMAGFDELRLGLEPGDFVLFTGQAPESVARSPIEYIPDDQLGWGISLSKMGPMHPHVPTSVCVWCSREFSLVGIESEPQSGSLGYICPDCKTRISRQF